MRKKPYLIYDGIIKALTIKVNNDQIYEIFSLFNSLKISNLPDIKIHLIIDRNFDRLEINHSSNPNIKLKNKKIFITPNDFLTMDEHEMIASKKFDELSLVSFEIIKVFIESVIDFEKLLIVSKYAKNVHIKIRNLIDNGEDLK